MARRALATKRPCAVSNHETERGLHPSRYRASAAPPGRETVVRSKDVQIAPRPALARGAAQRDRRHRRAGARPVDAARRHHRSPDPGEADPGGRLGVPPGARSRHDAPAGAAPPRHPAARHRREHLARHHLDLHLCPGAVFGPCRHLARRIRDAGFGAVSFRIHRALCLAFQRAGRGRGGGEIQGRPGAGLRHLQPHPVVDRARSQTARRRSSRGCRSSSAPTIRRRCRYSWCRASPTAPW